jgi:hypothetical protein
MLTRPDVVGATFAVLRSWLCRPSVDFTLSLQPPPKRPDTYGPVVPRIHIWQIVSLRYPAPYQVIVPPRDR